MAVVQRPLQDFTLAAEAISRISMTTDSLPQLVEQQRVAISQLVSHERQATLQDVDRMRQDTISKLENERAILLAAISSERAATIDSLKEERLAATRTLNAELSRALHATDSITHRRAEQILQQAPKVIDHFVMRVVQLCTVLSLITVLAWWMLRLRRPRVTDRVDSQVPSVPDEAHEHFSTVSQALSYSIRQELPHASGTRRAA
jgi:hypothetical protein